MANTGTPLALLRDMPAIEKLHKQLLDSRKASSERIEELRRMAKHVSKQNKETEETIWLEVRALVKGHPALPADYTEGTYGVALDGGVVSVERLSDREHEERCGCLLCSLGLSQ